MNLQKCQLTSTLILYLVSNQKMGMGVYKTSFVSEYLRPVLKQEIICDNATCEQDLEVQSIEAIKSDSPQGV